MQGLTAEKDTKEKPIGLQRANALRSSCRV